MANSATLKLPEDSKRRIAPLAKFTGKVHRYILARVAGRKVRRPKPVRR